MEVSTPVKNMSLLSLLLSQADDPSSVMIQNHHSTHEHELNTSRLILSHMIEFTTAQRMICVSDLVVADELLEIKENVVSGFFGADSINSVTPTNFILDRVFSNKNINAEIDINSLAITCSNLSDDEVAAVLLAQEDSVKYPVEVKLEKKMPSISWFKHIAKFYWVMHAEAINAKNMTTAISFSFTEGGAMIQTPGGIFIFISKYDPTAKLLMERLPSNTWKSVEYQLVNEASNLKLKIDSLLRSGEVLHELQELELESNQVSSDYLSVLDTLKKRAAASL